MQSYIFLHQAGCVLQGEPKNLVGEVVFYHLRMDELLSLLFSQQQLCCGVCRRRITLHLAKEITD